MEGEDPEAAEIYLQQIGGRHAGSFFDLAVSEALYTGDSFAFRLIGFINRGSGDGAFVMCGCRIEETS